MIGLVEEQYMWLTKIRHGPKFSICSHKQIYQVEKVNSPSDEEKYFKALQN